MTRSPYETIIPAIIKSDGKNCVLSIDLETLILKKEQFLTYEKIIAVSLSYMDGDMKTELYVAGDDSADSEFEILSKLDTFIRDFSPSVIIGYNQTGYDIPLLRMKMTKLPYGKQLWNLKHFLSVSYTLDMMQVIAEFLGKYDGDYRFRKLSEVVSHEAFADLPLDRKKHLVVREDMNIGEAIHEMWKSKSSEFLEYCRGDTRDVLSIFNYIFRVDRLE